MADAENTEIKVTGTVSGAEENTAEQDIATGITEANSDDIRTREAVTAGIAGRENDTETAEDEKPVKKGLVHYFLHGVISTYFVGIILMYVGAMFGTLFVRIPLKITGLLTDDHPVMVTAASYLAFIGVWGFVIGYILLFKSDSPYLRRIIGKTDKRAIIGWILGCLIIGGMNLICILCAMGNGDIHLYFGSFDIIPLVFLFVAVFIQSGAEEILCRGFMYRRLEKTYNPVVAMIFNSLFFTLLHVGNPGVTVVSLLNVFLCGVMFTLIIYYTDSMAFAMAGHAGWNFCQSIIFGLPNSGQVFPYSVLKLDAANARNSFFYNTGFGVEGTPMAVIILAVACAVIIILGQKKIIKRPEKITPMF